MTNKLSHNTSEQEMANYYQTGSSLSNILGSDVNISSSSLNNKQSQENLAEIEQKNIHMLILQRSLFIIKQKFSNNKIQIEKIYDKYRDKNYKNVKCINITNLNEIYKELTDKIQINILPYENFNELLTADLISEMNEDKIESMLNALVEFTYNNTKKYNTILYNKKLAKQENEKKKKLYHSFQINKSNLNNEFKIDNSENNVLNNSCNNFKILLRDDYDMNNSDNKLENEKNILKTNKILYTEVIPLIIADFIQEYMKNNIYIGIISTDNDESNKSTKNLNENIRNLYDVEIMKLYNNLNKFDPIEEKKELLKNLLLEEMTINNQIKTYKELIVLNANKDSKSIYLMNMVKRLKEKQKILKKKIENLNNRKNRSSSKSKLYIEASNFATGMNNSKISKKPKNIPTKQDLRETNLKDIFYFYSKQHSFVGKTPTFDQVLTNEQHLDLSEFSKFCVEFKILVKHNKITEIFKKNSTNSIKMTFDQFKTTLKKMSIFVNDERKQYLLERIKLYKIKLNEIIEKEKKAKKSKSKNKKSKKIKLSKKKEEQKEDQEEEQKDPSNEKEKSNDQNNTNDNKKEQKIPSNEEEKKIDQNNNNNEEQKISSNEEEKNNEQNNTNNNKEEQKTIQKTKSTKNNLLDGKEELEDKITKLQKDYYKLENKTISQLEEEFYLYLELDDQEAYRKKMVGYVLPFAIRGKDTRNPPKNVNKPPAKRDAKTIREMHDLLIQRHEELKKQKEIKQMREKSSLFEKRKKKFNKQIQKLEKNYENRIIKDNYKQIKKSEEDYQKEKNNKLTWQLIQNCDCDTFLLNDQRKDSGVHMNQIDEIFTDQNNQGNEDEDFINNVYTNDNFKRRKKIHTGSYNYNSYNNYGNYYQQNYYGTNQNNNNYNNNYNNYTNNRYFYGNENNMYY